MRRIREWEIRIVSRNKEWEFRTVSRFRENRTLVQWAESKRIPYCEQDQRECEFHTVSRIRECDFHTGSERMEIPYCEQDQRECDFHTVSRIRESGNSGAGSGNSVPRGGRERCIGLELVEILTMIGHRGRLVHLRTLSIHMAGRRPRWHWTASLITWNDKMIFQIKRNITK